MEVEPAAPPPGPTPGQTSKAEARQRAAAAGVLLDGWVPPPPVPAEAPPEPADALGGEDEREPATSAAPAATAITATVKMIRRAFMPTPREVEDVLLTRYGRHVAGPCR